MAKLNNRPFAIGLFGLLNPPDPRGMYPRYPSVHIDHPRSQFAKRPGKCIAGPSTARLARAFPIRDHHHGPAYRTVRHVADGLPRTTEKDRVTPETEEEWGYNAERIAEWWAAVDPDGAWAAESRLETPFFEEEEAHPFCLWCGEPTCPDCLGKYPPRTPFFEEEDEGDGAQFVPFDDALHSNLPPVVVGPRQEKCRCNPGFRPDQPEGYLREYPWALGDLYAADCAECGGLTVRKPASDAPFEQINMWRGNPRRVAYPPDCLSIDHDPDNRLDYSYGRFFASYHRTWVWYDHEVGTVEDRYTRIGDPDRD